MDRIKNFVVRTGSGRVLISDLEREKEMAVANLGRRNSYRRQILTEPNEKFIGSSERIRERNVTSNSSLLPDMIRKKYFGGKLSISDLEQEKKKAVITTRKRNIHVETCKEQRPRLKVSLSEMERDKETTTSAINTFRFSERRLDGRMISHSELIGEKSTAASGRVSDIPELPLQMYHSAQLPPNSIPISHNKIFTDQEGRSINLNNEFAHLNGGVYGLNHEEPIRPGAVAVFGAEYESDDENEIDFVNPNNFVRGTTSEILQMPDYEREVSRGSRKPESGEFQCATCVNNKRITKSRLYFFIVITIIITCGVVIGLIFSSGRRSSNKVSTISPPIFPTSFPPSLPEQLLLLHNESQIFDGESLGYSLGMTDNLLVASNNSSVYTFELGGPNVPIGRIFDGHVVSLSNTNRIVVQSGDIVVIYDYVGKDWEEAGEILLKSTYPTAVSISGDGSTILISTILKEKFLLSQAYRQEGDFWKKYGKEINNENQYHNVKMITNSLNFDGNYMSFGSRLYPWGKSASYTYKLNSNGYWDELQDEGKSGPFVSISNDGSTLVTGGYGFIYAKSIHNLSLSFVAIVANYRYNNEARANDLVLTVSDDGNRIAYSAPYEKVNIMDLQDKKWVKKAELPFMNLDVKALSFSKNGKLSVGVPKLGKVQVYKFDF